MKRLLVAALAAAALAAGLAVAATPAQADVYTDRVAWTMVRSSLAAAGAYGADHGGSYAGMTVRKLRRIDNRLSSIEIVTATKNRYCIQTNVLGSWAHYASTSAAVGAGRC